MTWRVVALLMAGCFGLIGTRAPQAHELRPAYLELKQAAQEAFNASWKVPAKGDRRLALYVEFPGNCVTGAPRSTIGDDAVVEHRQVECRGGLSGKQIAVEGLSSTLTDVLVRVEFVDGTTQVARLTPTAASFTVREAHSQLEVARTYFLLGVEHILLGIDHLLFVLALMLIVSGWRLLLYTITSFTIAHSITLAGATLGVFWLPGPPVEAVIALSIMFLASEMVRSNRGKESLTARLPWIVAFSFGLLHGLGFAGALAEIGLPQIDVPFALLMFNVGVEAGQLLFILGVLAAMGLIVRMTTAWPNWLKQAPAYGIGSVSAFWFVERVAGFWS